MTRERERCERTNARMLGGLRSERRARWEPDACLNESSSVGSALPTAPSAKNRGQGCLLRLANLPFVCLIVKPCSVPCCC